MNKSSSISLAMLIALSACSAQESKPIAARPLPEFSIQLSDDIVFEVDSRIELLSGVQAMTSGARRRGQSAPDSGSVYFSDLFVFFKPYADSRAVKASQALIDRGFNYDAPAVFALSIDGGAAMSPPVEGWSSDLKRRAGGASRLDDYRDALARLFASSGFEAFLAVHADDYRRWLSEASAGFDAKSVSSWLEGFYGRPEFPTVYHFLLAPGLFPGGGYGISRVAGEGETRRMHIYQVIRAQGSPDGEPGFPTGRDLAMLGLHEFGHSFVNPALEAANADGMFQPGMEAIFAPVAGVMKKQAYGNVTTFFNELVLRAACIIAVRDLGLQPGYDMERAMSDERGKGFYPIARVVALLEEYRADRVAYPSFDSFAPVLLGRLAADAKAIVDEGSKIGYR